MSRSFFRKAPALTQGVCAFKSHEFLLFQTRYMRIDFFQCCCKVVVEIVVPLKLGWMFLVELPRPQGNISH